MINLYEYKQVLEDDGIIFSFSGPMSHEIIVSIGSTIRQKVIEDDDGNKNIALKVFAVFVEQAENIIHYSEEKSYSDSELSFGIVAIGKKKGSFFISCGNKIKNDKEANLHQSLSKISGMDKDELKAYYKEKRRSETPSNSKGAGIGFIEMARKSSKPLEFAFKKIDSDYSFFNIEINL